MPNMKDLSDWGHWSLISCKDRNLIRVLENFYRISIFVKSEFYIYQRSLEHNLVVAWKWSSALFYSLHAILQFDHPPSLPTTHPTPIPGSYSCAACFRLVRGNNRVFASLIMYQATEHIVIGSDDSPGTADTGSHGGNLLGVWSVAVLSSGILMETEIFRKIPFLPSGGL